MNKTTINKNSISFARNNYWYILPILFSMVVMGCQKKEAPLFKLLSPQETGIYFQNEIIENDTHNILNFANLYTGSGVGIGNFNNDGNPDIFLGGNMESSRLYLNDGKMSFRDITKKTGISTDRWITGVAIVDINSDGWDDIYLSVSGKALREQRKNLLFINKQELYLIGNNANDLQVFVNQFSIKKIK